jgi:hypothetical protein
VAVAILRKYRGDHGGGARRACAVVTAGNGATHVRRPGQDEFGFVTSFQVNMSLASWPEQVRARYLRAEQMAEASYRRLA